MIAKLNTKLRLENSSLGTYELTAGENNTYSCTLPKGLKPENLLGTIINIDDASYAAIILVSIVGTGSMAGKYLLTALSMQCAYDPETGIAQIGTIG